MAVATKAEFWASERRRARCKPPPPEDFELLLHPAGVLEIERQTRLERRLRDKKIRVVGGKRCEISSKRLIEAGADAVHWSESEKRKKARPEKDWSNLSKHRDICVIVTGKIGHDVSGLAKTRCASAGIVPLEAQWPTRVAETVLGAFAEEHLSSEQGRAEPHRTNP